MGLALQVNLQPEVCLRRSLHDWARSMLTCTFKNRQLP